MKIDKRRFELQEKSNVGWIRTPYVKDLENIGEAQDCLRTYMKNIDFANIQLRLREIGDNSDNSQTELRAPKESCSSDKEVAQPYSKFDKTTKEVTSND